VPRLCLPIDEWPPDDRKAWAAAHRRGGLLDDDGLAADWAPDTSQLIASGYGRFLSFLAQIGELDPVKSPAERITRIYAGGTTPALWPAVSCNCVKPAG